MAKGTWIALGVLGAIALVVLGVLGSGVSTYNAFVNEREGVDAQAKQVDVQYQKAFNVVPQIAQLAEQYLQNESQVQTSVAALRSGLAQAQGGSFEQKEEFVQSLNSTTAIVIRAVNENYPQLRSVDLYQTTIFEIINVQNEIAMEKVRYNDRVLAYNAHRQQCCIPLFVANAFGFEPKEYIGFKDRPNQTSFPEGAQL